MNAWVTYPSPPGFSWWKLSAPNTQQAGLSCQLSSGETRPLPLPRLQKAKLLSNVQHSCCSRCTMSGLFTRFLQTPRPTALSLESGSVLLPLARRDGVQRSSETALSRLSRERSIQSQHGRKAALSVSLLHMRALVPSWWFSQHFILVLVCHLLSRGSPFAVYQSVSHSLFHTDFFFLPPLSLVWNYSLSPPPHFSLSLSLSGVVFRSLLPHGAAHTVGGRRGMGRGGPGIGWVTPPHHERGWRHCSTRRRYGDRHSHCPWWHHIRVPRAAENLRFSVIAPVNVSNKCFSS